MDKEKKEPQVQVVRLPALDQVIDQKIHYSIGVDPIGDNLAKICLYTRRGNSGKGILEQIEESHLEPFGRISKKELNNKLGC